MKKILKTTLKVLLAIFFLWVAFTLWVESAGPVKKKEFGVGSSNQAALVVYDPDPIYNFDEQICESFAKGLSDNKWKVTVATVTAAKKLNEANFDLYVFCANTYNWSPDWTICRYIERLPAIENKNVVIITVGARSTRKSQRLFEEAIQAKNSHIIDSKQFWLWRPNDTTRLKESNVKVGAEMSRSWANSIAKTINPGPRS